MQQPAEKFTLQQKDGVWRLSAPVDADADTARVGKLAGDLSRLNAVEHVAAESKPEELEKEYGLGKEAPERHPDLQGGDQEGAVDPADRQAARPPRMNSSPRWTPSPASSSSARKSATPSSSRRWTIGPRSCGDVQPPEIKEIKVRKQGEDEYRLVKGDMGWKVAGPFEAATHAPTVQRMIENLAPLLADRFVAHDAKDGKEFGLDQPALRITMLTGGEDRKDAKDGKEADKPTERVLIVGGETKNGPPGRFAKLGNSDAVFVIGLIDFTGIDQSALNLLDRKLLALDRKNIIRVESISGMSRMVLDRKGDAWHVSSADPPFTPDSLMLEGLLTVWTKLDAERIRRLRSEDRLGQVRPGSSPSCASP